VRVSDSGAGFDAAGTAPAPRQGLGLISLRERLSHIGGTVELQSTPGIGTLVVLTAPLISAESEQLERSR